MYIYLAGPMTVGHRIHNIRDGILAAHRIMKRGHFVYIPHLNDFTELVAGEEHYEFWMAQDFGWIKRCDALVRIPGKSLGADREVEYANKIGRIVFGSETENGLFPFMNSTYWDKTEYWNEKKKDFDAGNIPVNKMEKE